MPQLRCAGKYLDLSNPQVMGILNITPDSFSDGGLFLHPQKALEQAELMHRQGASIIDVGGESTRPGAKAVGEQEELDRVIPVIEAIRDLPVVVSVDTSKALVMREAVKAGAGLINDVCALQNDGCKEAVSELKVPVCLMHMQGEPRTMQQNPQYGDVVSEVREFLANKVAQCEGAGIEPQQIIIDPGFGFGKTLEHNLALVKHLDQFHQLGKPLLLGFSRKSSIGMLLGDKPPQERLFGSVALAVLALWQGASIFRVHDVEATMDALKVVQAVMHG